MGKIVFNDGVEVEISAETEKNLRSLVTTPLITFAEHDCGGERVIVRLTEKAIRRVKDGVEVLVFDLDKDLSKLTNSRENRFFDFGTQYRTKSVYGRIK